jgi:hypothetical protein
MLREWCIVQLKRRTPYENKGGWWIKVFYSDEQMKKAVLEFRKNGFWRE